MTRKAMVGEVGRALDNESNGLREGAGENCSLAAKELLTQAPHLPRQPRDQPAPLKSQGDVPRGIDAASFPPGSIVWHSSDEDSGPDCGISVALGNGRVLWCGEITNAAHEKIEDCGSAGGFWLILYGPKSKAVIAKFTDPFIGRAFADYISAQITKGSDPWSALLEEHGHD